MWFILLLYAIAIWLVVPPYASLVYLLIGGCGYVALTQLLSARWWKHHP
jgi:hypothetical protein